MDLEKIEEFESIDFKDFINELVLNKENSVNLREELDDDLEKFKINDDVNEDLNENKSEKEELNELDEDFNEEFNKNISDLEELNELDDDVNEEFYENKYELELDEDFNEEFKEELDDLEKLEFKENLNNSLESNVSILKNILNNLISDNEVELEKDLEKYSRLTGETLFNINESYCETPDLINNDELNVNYQISDINNNQSESINILDYTNKINDLFEKFNTNSIQINKELEIVDTETIISETTLDSDIITDIDDEESENIHEQNLMYKNDLLELNNLQKNELDKQEELENDLENELEDEEVDDLEDEEVDDDLEDEEVDDLEDEEVDDDLEDEEVDDDLEEDEEVEDVEDEDDIESNSRGYNFMLNILESMLINLGIYKNNYIDNNTNDFNMLDVMEVIDNIENKYENS